MGEALAGGLGFFAIRYSDERSARLQVATRLRDTRSGAAALEDRITGTQREIEDREALARELRHRMRDLRSQVDELRTEIRPLRRLRSALIPSGTTLVKAETIDAPQMDSRVLVALWQRGEYAAHGSGLVVWQPSIGGMASNFHVAFSIEMERQANPQRTVRVGPPGAKREENTVAMDVAHFVTGDVTGDGVDDILTVEDTHGSGGCGIRRVLAITPTGVRQIFRRDACEMDISAGKAMLRIDSAIYPKGCNSIHGCGRRRTLFRWTGDGWERADSRVIARF